MPDLLKPYWIASRETGRKNIRVKNGQKSPLEVLDAAGSGLTKRSMSANLIRRRTEWKRLMSGPNAEINSGTRQTPLNSSENSTKILVPGFTDSQGVANFKIDKSEDTDSRSTGKIVRDIAAKLENSTQKPDKSMTFSDGSPRQNRGNRVYISPMGERKRVTHQNPSEHESRCLRGLNLRNPTLDTTKVFSEAIGTGWASCFYGWGTQSLTRTSQQKRRTINKRDPICKSRDPPTWETSKRTSLVDVDSWEANINE